MEIYIFLACALSTSLIWGLFYLLNGRKRLALTKNSKPKAEEASSEPAAIGSNTTQQTEAVGAFYDATTDAFLQVYGDVIQAFRTHDLKNLLDYQGQAMHLKPGMRVLDAGCGVCGPAIHFASHFGVQVDAVTASAVQQSEATKRIRDAGLERTIKVLKGDYHRLPEYFEAGSYDVVYFLESFGHSANKTAAIAAAWTMLKPGGMLYIKDLFAKIPAIPEHAAEIQRNIERINTAYRYQVGDLNHVLTAIRRQGYILSAVKTIDIPLEDFENLTISNQFQELTGIHRIDNLQEYLFPVDFFELICLKPWHDLAVGNSRYFLQNLYYLKVKGKTEAEL